MICSAVRRSVSVVRPLLVVSFVHDLFCEITVKTQKIAASRVLYVIKILLPADAIL